MENVTVRALEQPLQSPEVYNVRLFMAEEHAGVVRSDDKLLDNGDEAVKMFKPALGQNRTDEVDSFGFLQKGADSFRLAKGL